MSSSQRHGTASPILRRVAPWTVVLLLGAVMVGMLPSAFAQNGTSAADAIPIGADGQFTATTAAGQSTWFHFLYAGGSQNATISVTYTPTDASRTDFNVFTGPADSLHQEGQTPTRSGNTLSFVYSDPSQRDVYVQVLNNNSTAVSYVGTVTPSGAVSAMPSGTATPTPGPAANTPQDALTVGADGALTGSIAPRRAVWYRFWYGNPGADAVVAVGFVPSADNADLNVYTGTDITNLGPSQQSGTPTRSGNTLSRRVNVPNAQWIYFNVADNNDSADLAYSGTVSPAFAPPVTPTAGPTAAATATPAPTSPPQTAPPVAHDARYFTETGYRIDNDPAWDFFQSQGGIETFGFPVSRTFNFLGCPVQFFQRRIIQVCPGQGTALINMLDPEIFPYNQINFSVYPAPDTNLKNNTPKVGAADYDQAISNFVNVNVPNSWNGRPVGFLDYFNGTGGLPIWGAPISQPAFDPTNQQFVYQRFQRGIMHFTVGQGTRGILLADYLKSILTGQNLPADLRQESQGSRYYQQYCPGGTNWLCRPNDLPGTDLTFAFERG